MLLRRQVLPQALISPASVCGGDPGVNNGRNVTQATLPPLDCVVLLPEICDIAALVFNLASGRWQQISLPCVPPVNARSVQDVFGDGLKGTYGADWAVYSYDAVNNGYEDISLNDTLKQGVGYWVIHHNGVNAELDLPEGGTQTMVTPANQCAGDKACYRIPLASRSRQVQWNMVGYPFFNEVGLDRLRVVTKGGARVGGCSEGAGIVEDRFWHYEGGV